MPSYDEMFADILKIAEVVAGEAQKALFQGKVVEILEQRQLLSTVRWDGDVEDNAFTVNNSKLKPIPEPGKPRQAPFNIAPQKWERICQIFKADPKFKMTISCSPDKVDEVGDEITGAENVLSVASDKKQFTSWDVVCSANPELNTLLEGTGAEFRPYRSGSSMLLLHGPRKSFFVKLVDSGFQLK